MPPKPKPTSLRDELKQEHESGQGTPADRADRIARRRAKATTDAFAAAVPAGGGRVQLGNVAAARIELAGPAVEVWLADHDGAPDYRIVNPPTLVADPAGDVELPGPGGQKIRYREDPLAAIGEAISAHQVTARRRQNGAAGR